MTSSAGDRWLEPRVLLAQWAGVLLGAAGWALHLQGSYLLAAFACTDVLRLTMHGMSLVALAIAGAGVYFGWRTWQAARDGAPEGHRVERSRFMGVAGIALSGYFALVIIAQWIPSFFLEPCRY
jgi:hypothetical protein